MKKMHGNSKVARDKSSYKGRRRHFMRKYAKVIWISLLIIALQLGSISSVLVTYAETIGNDVTSTVASQFIQGVDIKEKVSADPVTGSTVGDTLIGQPEIDKETEFYLWYDFTVPNDHSIKEGDFILFDVPKEISFPTGGSNSSIQLPDLVTEEGDSIAKAYLEPGNKIKIMFTNTIEQLSNVGGAFFIAGGFDQNEIKTDGSETEINFTIPTNTIKLTFKADPLPEPEPVIVKKDGAITNGTNIEWKITIDKADFSVTNIVNNAVLVDVIPPNQSLDVSSIKVNNVTPLEGDISFEENTLSLSLGTLSTKQEITFVTSLTEQALLDALAEGKTSIDVTNNAKLTHDDDQTTNAENPKTVTIPINILSKSGSYLAATTATNTKNIKWTIVVNSDKLAFNNAVITDTLPNKLTYIAGSETITGAPGVTPIVNGSNITFNLGNITDEVTITYETEIDPNYFNNNADITFTNKAELTWDGLQGTGVVKEAQVGVGSGLFTKSGAGYNRSNGVISWSISINNQNINLAAPTITDIIQDDQQYIEGSAKIVDHQGNVYSDGSFNYTADNANEKPTLSYTFNSAINSKYIITFDTKPVSTELITANQKVEFSNTATLTSGTITVNSKGKQSYESNVFKKDQAGYDLNTRTITWKFTVNENGAAAPSSNPDANDPSLYQAIPLNDIIITDNIPAGLEYADNFSIVDKDGADASSLVTVNVVNGVLKIEFKQPITTKYVISFDTKIIDDSQFTSQNNQLNNGNFNVNNEALLTHDKTTVVNKDAATQEIKNHIVSKKGIPTTFGNKYIDWVVYLNSNAVNLNQLLDVDTFWLIDQLQEGLELDTTSVALIAYDKAIKVPDSIPADGNDGLGSGRNISLDGTHIKYDAKSREFRLNFPGDAITTAYKLSFRTFVTESVTSGTQFSNGINLFGSKLGTPVHIENAYQSEDARQVSFLQAGSVGYGNLGKFVVKKVDSKDTNKKLSGATFALYDRFGNKVQEKATVDGQLEFNRIKSDIPYYIKEVEAPVGYLLSGEEVSVDGKPVTPTAAGDIVQDAIKLELNSVTNQKSLELTFKNKEIKADIEFKKQDEANDKLAGAQFGLFTRGASANSTPIVTATSTNEGIVSFKNVPYGSYDIRELAAPAGYRTLTDVVHAVEVTANDHDQTLNLSAVSNELIKANIKFMKINGTGTGVEGAEFSLYDNANQFVKKTESLADGTVEFKDILAGQYTIRETKAPLGYLPLSGVIGTATVTEAEHGTTIVLADVTNEWIQSNIEFVKNNENNQPLAGATFGLYKDQNELVQTQVSQSDGKVTFTDIGEGSYTVKEISAPTGYFTMNDVIHNVTITANDHNQTILLKPVTNKLIEANIEFVKVSEKGQVLAGAVFELLDDNEDIVQTVTSDAGGKVTFVDVREGEYVIREKTAPTGYHPLTSSVATVEIDAQKHNTTVTLPDVTNQIIKGDVEFVKVDKNTSKPLKNAGFALYEAADTAYDNEIATAFSDDQGIVRFEDVEYGDYTIIEIAPPSGYSRSSEKLSVSVTEEGKIYSLGNFENQLLPPVEPGNGPNPNPGTTPFDGTIEVNKVNTLGVSLAGAKFGLYDSQGKLVAEAVTNTSGIARFTQVIPGVYTVKELEAPVKYVKSDQVETATISSIQTYVKFTFVNERSNDAPWPNVSVQKVDDAGTPLSGVKFALYKATDTSFTTPVANSITNAKGIASFTNIPPGKYMVKETEALQGYLLTDVILSVTVTEDETTYYAGTVKNRVIRGDIVISKVNELNEPLQGAKFGLHDANDKLVKVVISNREGYANFNDIPYGSYNLKELDAPESYQKSDDVIAINITVDGKVQTYTIVNKKANDSSDDKGQFPGLTPEPSEDSKPDIDNSKPNPDGATSHSKPVPDNGNTNGNDDSTSGSKQNNELPKTGDSITTMMWLFVGSGLLLLMLWVVGRRIQKQ